MRSLLASLVILIGSCSADGGGGRRDSGGGGDDAGGSDVGPPGLDAGPRADAGPRPDTGPFDGGPPGLQCEPCTTHEDCGTAAFCVELPSGGNVCLRGCAPDLPDCPPRFDCIDSLLTDLPDPVCTPVGERCCVDYDADDHGVGVGCRGTDCDETIARVHSDGVETCDGVDEDCDGMIDEGDPGEGVVCSTGMAGACSSGTTECTDGRIVCLPGASTTAETCNGIDDDCDSNVDEDDMGRALTRSCYDGPPGTAGVGGCTEGVQTCAGAEFRSCVGQQLPSTEGCDGVDQDCDGTVDDGNPGGGIACTAPMPGVCAAGTTRCTGGRVVCEGAMPSTETCDYRDEDCDSRTDEGFTFSGDPAAPGVPFGVGEACAIGLGTCRRGGVVVCSGGTARCNATVVAPGTETCNYLDDDCDGTVDDGFVDGAGMYSSDRNCGACGIDCTAIYMFPMSFGTCGVTAGRASCRLNCSPGAFNLNGIPDDGCEFGLDTMAIYVSGEDPAAADDATCGLGPVGTGAGHHPCRTIGNGIARARGTGRVRVLVADALYSEAVTLESGRSLLGGYRADTWERHLSTTLTTIRAPTGAGHRKTITAMGIGATTLVEGFVIEGATASSPGANSYAVFVDGGTSALELRRNVIYAGNGAPGGAGPAGVDGADGAVGSPGVNAFDTGSFNCATSRAGPSGGSRSCGATDVSGGAGGGVFCPLFFDNVGPPYSPGSSRNGTNGSGPGGGTGGTVAFDGQTNSAEMCLLCYLPPGGGTMTGGNGVEGSTGGNGGGGGGAASAGGMVSGSDWVGATGGGGSSGAHGGGGGGGGSGGGGDGTGGSWGCTDDLGATGGGGGSGACAGTAGQGGTAGGGSFGVFIVNTTSRPVLTSNTIYRGFGGTGGNGGRGGAGGTGGRGANGGLKSTANPSFCTGDGGVGGDGGNGGHGGGGGGGAGGVAYGVFAEGISGYGGTTNTFPASGGGGAGGGGGPSIGTSGTPGAAGASANTN